MAETEGAAANAELLRALACLAEPPSDQTPHLAEILGFGPLPQESAWEDLFLFQLYPYASVYLSAEGMLGGETRDRIAGFWRALELEPPKESDHLATMLALHARLSEAEADADGAARRRWRHARRSFLHEHLLSWLPVYLARVEALAPELYRRWARLLGEILHSEAAALGVPEQLGLHLRQAPGLADPRQEGGEAFLESLLAPARSGLVLVRDDLLRCARELELGGRIGERRFVLRALLGQNSGAVFRWLTGEAQRATEDYRNRLEPFGAVSDFWTGRCRATAQLLEELQSSPPLEEGTEPP